MNPSVFLRLLAPVAFLLTWSIALPTFGQTGGVAAPAAPGAIITYDAEDQRLTLNVTAMPLRQVLEAISTQSGVRFRLPAATLDSANRRITQSFERMALEHAIKQLLGPSNTVMIYGTQEAPDDRHKQIVLKEVTILDGEFSPVVATPAVAADTQSRPVVPATPQAAFTPEQIQAKKAAAKDRRAAKKGEVKEEKRNRSGMKKSADTQAQPVEPSEKSATQPSTIEETKPEKSRKR